MNNENHRIYAEIAEIIKSGGSGRMQTVIKSEKGAVADIERILYRDQETESTPGAYYDYFRPKERLIILGGGHIALPLVEIGKLLGFYIIVVDDRPSFANRQRFPGADEVCCEAFERVFDNIVPRLRDYLIIVTRGHRHDAACLRGIFKYAETLYTGMIGSRRRVGELIENLIEEGLDRDRLARVCTPIGLSIGALTPEEISVSIMAQVIRRKRLEQVGAQPLEAEEFDPDLWLALAEKPENPCCVATILSTKGSVPRKKGAKMIIYPEGRVVGSIGGGCSESEVIAVARRLVGSGRFEIVHVDMTGEVAESEGMVCGGSMAVLVEDLI